MKALRRCVLAAALSLTAAAGGLLVAGTAHAQTVASGSLSFSGDAGEFITQSKSYSYSTSNGDGLSVSSATGGEISVSVNAYNGDWWTLDIAAPASQVLAPGTYTAAHRYPFNGTGPGLSLTGDGRGCNTLTGSFTVTKAVFGPQGYVQAFDATFQQNCEGGTLAARGQVHISNPPAPPQASPKPTKTSGPHATPTGPQQATPSGGSSASAVGSGNAAANDSEDNTAARPALVQTASRLPLSLIRVAAVAYAVLNGVGLLGLAVFGIVMAVRRR
jgi:hypothetical protein